MNTTTDFRYPGSRPFNDTSLDRSLFFGRNHEKASLLHMVLAENLVVFFAKSGLGKTSLLNAGIMEPLRQREYIPFMIRLNIPDIDPLQAVYEGIKDAVDRNRIEYTPGEENNLWQYFKTVEFWSSEDTLQTPVLILDQFEELFTLHSPEKRKAFITQLADLVKDRVPKDLRKTLKPGEGLPYGDMPPKVKIIISIREDFLGQLEELAHEIPDILHNRFRLVALTREQAKEAIVKPAQLDDEQIVTASFQYAPEAVEAMLDFFCERRERKTKVRTDEVEPFQLQLLCQHIESKVVREKVDKEGAADIVIQKDDLGGETGMRRVLKDFYVNQINRLDSPWKKRRVRSLCEKRLISDTDRRLSLEEEMIERKYKVPRKLLADLVNSRLLRAEPRVGSVYYELSHDTLVEPIRKFQSERRTRKAKVFAIMAILLVMIITPFLLELKQRDEINEIYREAGGLKDREKFTEAIEKYKKILEIDKSFVSAYLELGEIYYRIERLDESARKYRDAIQIDPELSQAYRRIGDIDKRQEKFKEAIENYKKALKYGDLSRETYSGLVISYLEQGKYTEAIHEYDDAIEVKPEYADIYMYLVPELKKEGMSEQVEEVYRKALETFDKLNSDKRNENTYKQVAVLYIKQGKLDQAIKVYKDAITVRPEYADIYSDLIRELKKQGMGNQVDRIYEIALKVDSKRPSYYLNLGYALKLEGRKKYDKAIESYEKAIQINPQLSKAYEALGEVYERQKNFDKAIEYYTNALNIDARNGKAYRKLAVLYIKQGKLDQAIKIYKDAITVRPEYADIYSDLIRELKKQGMGNQVDRIYEIALKVDSKRPSYYLNLGYALKLEGRKKYDKAIESYEKAIQINPQLSKAYEALGEVYERQKNFDKAIEYYTNALNIDARNGKAYRKLAVLYIKQGKLDQAIKIYERAISVSTEYADIYSDLIRELNNQGMGNQVDRIYEIASKVDSKRLSYYFNLGMQFMYLNRYDDAIQNFKKAVQINPKYAKAYAHLGYAFNRQAKYQEAKKNFKKAIDLFPENIGYQMDFAEINLTTGYFDKAFERAHQVLEDPKISTHRKLPMGFISISSLLFQGKRPEAFAELKKFIVALNSLPKYYRVFGWSYEVSKKFIRDSKQLEETDKTLLLKLIDILESPKPKADEKLQDLESYLSKISKQ